MSMVKMSFDVGVACQSIYNVYESGTDLYRQVDLIHDIVKQLFSEEFLGFQIFQSTMFSWIFLFKSLGDSHDVQKAPFKSRAEALASAAHGIKVLAEVIFASISTAGSFCRDFDGACESIQKAWNWGSEEREVACNIKQEAPLPGSCLERA